MKRRLLPILVLIFCTLASLRAQAQEDEPKRPPLLTPVAFSGITAPQPGQALQGTVEITGETPVDEFQLAELSFGYSGASGPSFPIAAISAPALGTLAQWDTTLLTDGVYDLHLLVTLVDGKQLLSTVPGLRVRNYTPIETNTPAPLAPTTIPQAEYGTPGTTGRPETNQEGTETLHASQPASARATNPAHLPVSDIANSLGRGALAAVGIFSILALYALLRRDRG